MRTRDNRILRFTKFSLFGLAFMGFVIYPNVLYPDVFTKGLYVRFLIACASVGLLWLVSLGRLPRRRILTPLAAGVLIFVCVVVVSMFFSSSIFRSFWGEAQRMEGVLGLLHYAALFFVAREIFSREDWIRYFKYVLLSVPLLSLYALLQYISWRTGQSLPLVFNPAGQPGSLFGNPVFFSMFLLFAAGFGGMVYHLEKNARWRVFSLIAIVISVGMIIWLGVRGEVLGVVAGLMTFFGLWAWWQGGKKERRAFRLAIVGILAAIISLVALKPWLHDYYPTLLLRIVNLPVESSFQTRWLSLNSSIRAFADSPKTILIGWGQEHFITGYNKYYNPLHGTHEDAWFDRAHNKFADILVMQGVLGLLAYLALFVLIGWYLWRLSRAPAYRALAASVGGLLVAYGTQNLTIFDLPQTYVSFFLLMAFLDAPFFQESFSSSARPEETPRQGELRSRWIGSVLGVVGTAGILAVIFYTILMPLRQSERYLYYFKTHKGNELFEGWSKLFAPKNFVQYSLLDDMWRRLQNQNALRDPNFGPVIDTLALEMKSMLARDTTDAQMALRLASVYTNRGIGLGGVSQGAVALGEGEEYIRRAIELSPGRQENYYVLAFNLQGQGRGEEAVRTMQEAVALNPATKKARYYLAVNRALIGELEEAIRELEEIRKDKWFNGFRPIEAKEVIRLYGAAGREDLLLGLYEEFLVQGHIRDREVYVLLLRGLIQTQDTRRVIYWANEYKKVYPEFEAAMDELIRLTEEGAWEELRAMF